MERKRTVKLNWNSIGRLDDDDQFFEPPIDLVGFDSDDSSSDDEFEDSRLSLSEAAFANSFRASIAIAENHYAQKSASIMEDYSMWMADPGDIKERRKRLHQGMGLVSNRDLLSKVTSSKFARAISRKPPEMGKKDKLLSKKEESFKEENEDDAAAAFPFMLVRSRSEGDIHSFSANTKKRKEEMLGPGVSKHRLIRTVSELTPYRTGNKQFTGPVIVKRKKRKKRRTKTASMTDECIGSFFLIKNLDTGKEFIVKECNEKGMWNKLSDLQTGKQLTMEEFEKHVGYSRMVKELMHRAHGRPDSKMNSYISKSVRYSKKTSVALMKNIKDVANDVAHSMSLKITDPTVPPDQKPKPTKNPQSSSEWIKVQQQGKTLKEFTGLQMCQEIQAHEGSIWTIKFSGDARYLASAGEDKVIHIWEVQDVEVIKDEQGKAKAPTTKKKDTSVPEYVSMPDSVFAFSERPLCTLTGHQDEVLDLSWSKSEFLLSSSMDKTVRLWNIEGQNCVKMFAHNDYVTCVQFNPKDEDHFISGSLDAKVRIWNVPDRKVVDWIDQKDMVSALCYAPDGEAVIIGLQKGICRVYKTTDCKLEEEDQFDVEPKKKPPNKKITGFQFYGTDPAELLITSADSYIRIHDGTNFTQKYKGFKITTSQFSATYGQDGKYVVCASEDSQVYVWKREEVKNVGGKPRYVSVQSHENFPCKDVSVAISWPGNDTKNNEQPSSSPSKKQQEEESAQPTDTADPPGESPSPSQSHNRSTSWSPPSSEAAAATAWGMVIVTASSGGEIRVYQNFGLPVKVKGQANLFIA
ncbi:PREDICTED: WD repeat-containing protein 44-like [Ipomoea nil]|uniref:WD repeat-containing protein 44-like n=1 Tax=Ipomoea nil TaxID=35883 RepID=UPI0009015970|nr:PREDICTED: WD repeat-containing protein 44-like [Ipomoea nil]